MKNALTFALALATLVAVAGTDTAEAGRLGGGRSMGAQRQMTPPPAMPKAAPAAPTAPSQAVPGKAAAPAAAGASRWLGPLAGLAAGLGLAALFSHFGLSESFGSLMLILLLVVGGIVIVRMLMARRSAPAANPLGYAGANNASPSRVEPHLGAARTDFEPVMGGAAQPATPGRYPPGFDPVPFVEQAKRQFRMLQAAYDTGNREALTEVLTPEMLTEVTREIAQRGTHVATEVMRLDADILEVKTEGDRHWMSVRFTGMLREDGTVLPKEFDEIWNLTKPVDDSTGWLLAGIQQTHEMA